jgi:flagellar protein FliJ
MVRSKRFEPIREIANNSANELSRSVADAERRLAEAERQLEQLKTYRSDYVAQSSSGPGAVDAVRLQNFRSFLDRLGEAVRVQAELVGAARADYEAKRARWSEKRVEVEALGKVVERLRVDERRRQERRDQSEMDEAALHRLNAESFERR